jgi:hypothetical protein
MRHFKYIEDSLLAYSYSKVKSEDNKLVLRAGNGAEVIFESGDDGDIKVSGNPWAVRQVSSIICRNPGFVCSGESIRVKDVSINRFESVRSELLR